MYLKLIFFCFINDKKFCDVLLLFVKVWIKVIMCSNKILLFIWYLDIGIWIIKFKWMIKKNVSFVFVIDILWKW